MDIHHVTGEFIIPFQHEVSKNVQVTNLFKNESFMCFKTGYHLPEYYWKLRIVCPWPYMMDRMVTVIPAFMIIGRVQTNDIACKIILWFLRVDKCMLGPVAKHHHKTGKDEWNDQYHKRSF